jgi:membrane protein
MLALIVTIAAALSISVENIRIAINTSIPSGLANILNGIISGDGINFNIIVFYFSAILLASNGTYSMINTSNEIYKVKPKNIVHRRAKAIVMIFIIMSILLFLFAVPIFGGTISKIIIQITGSNLLPSLLRKLLSILKRPIVFAILFFGIKMMYIIAPDEEIPSKTTNRGALCAAIGWILSTEIFAFYLEKFAKYDVFYGSISNILVLFLWIYLLSYIFVLGMVINASSFKEGSD